MAFQNWFNCANAGISQSNIIFKIVLIYPIGILALIYGDSFLSSISTVMSTPLHKSYMLNLLSPLRKIMIVVLVSLLSACSTSNTADSGTLDSARFLFGQRCATAGEFIKRTVDDVEGVFLLKLRPYEINYSDQFQLDDPYGRDYIGSGYIESFLQAHHALPTYTARAKRKSLRESEQAGYAFVDVWDAKNEKRDRYTASVEQPGKSNPSYVLDYFRVVVASAPASGPSPRYGITYDDISTLEDRKHWIAGSSLKIIDLHVNEVIAERIGYMMDPGQGRTRGGRSPWLIAASHACPVFDGPHPTVSQGGQTNRFVEKVLRPSPQNSDSKPI